MSFCLFVSFADADAARVAEALRGLRAGESCRLHVPAKARDPYLDDGAPPALVAQIYFAALDRLQAALPPLSRSLGEGARWEAMAVRRFPVAQPGFGHCTYLVAYSGPAEDPDAWHAHYLSHHAPIMAELPGIRELEVYAPIDRAGEVDGWRRVRSLQRNKVAFDSPQALEDALNSPVRAKMRADFSAFPAYAGTVTHAPMLTVDPWQKI